MSYWKLIAAFGIPLPFALVPIAAVAWFGGLTPFSEPQDEALVATIAPADAKVLAEVPDLVAAFDAPGCGQDKGGSPAV